MSAPIIVLIILLVAALILFSLEVFSADVIAIGLALALAIGGLIAPEDAFRGFGSDTVVMILGLLILTAALSRTGVVAIAGRWLVGFTGNDGRRVLWVVMAASAILGAVMSNTATTAFFLPITIGLARRAKINASRLLLPLAFSSILSSAVTLVSTSTNIIISGLLVDYGLAPMGMFELAPVGIPIVIVGIVYMAVLGQRLLPNRADETEPLTEEFGLRPYLTEIVVKPGSHLIGKTLAESDFGRQLDLTVLRVVRQKRRYLAPSANLSLAESDVLLIEGARDEILKIKETAGIEIKADAPVGDPDLQTEETGLAEVILLTRSPLVGRTLKSARFRERYGLQVLAINRHSETIRRKLSVAPLRMGDVLLVQGPRHKLLEPQEDAAFELLGEITEKRPNLRRARMAVGIFGLVFLLATFNILPLATAVMLGVLLAFLSRIITPEEAYREVEWRVLVLIACMLAVGEAMDATGAAQFLATQIAGVAGQVSPLWLLAGFFWLTVLLSQTMSHQAAAVVVVPIAMQTALQLGLNPRTFALVVAVAASCSYLTPLEPSCVMVYGPGRYRFADFFRVGSLLTLLIFGVSMLLVPWIWPLGG